MYGMMSMKEAEVYGLREVINWVLNMGFSSVVFEMNANTIVNAFHSSQTDESEFGIAIQDCRFLCQQGVQFSVCFVRRQANKAAHARVRESYALAYPFYYVLPPDCIEGVLLNDIS